MSGPQDRPDGWEDDQDEPGQLNMIVGSIALGAAALLYISVNEAEWERFLRFTSQVPVPLHEVVSRAHARQSAQALFEVAESGMRDIREMQKGEA